jgi:AcrR family transcriptional regulator
MPRQERSEHTMNIVLDSAAAVFARFGFAGARMDEIVELTGLTKGAVYFHFTSKRALADALVSDKYRQWSPIVQAVGSSGFRGLDAIRELSVQVSKVFRDDVRVRAGMRLSQELFTVTSEQNPYTGWARIIAGYLRDGIADGSIRRDLDSDAVARNYVRAFFGVYMIAVELNELEKLPTQVSELWDVLFAGITSRESVRRSAVGPTDAP